MTHLPTVVELDSFLKRAKAIMSDEERMDIGTYLAANPEADVLLGGGLRSLNDQTQSVIASEARQSSVCVCGTLDCFASLAMTTECVPRRAGGFG